METLHTIVLILHVLGATVIIGIAFVSLIIQLRPPITHDLVILLDRIWKIAGITIGIQVLTGLYLAMSEWDKVSANPLFWVKIVLVFVVGLTIGLVSRSKFARMKDSDKPIAGDIRLAWLGLLVFAVVASIGVILVEAAG